MDLVETLFQEFDYGMERKFGRVIALARKRYEQSDSGQDEKYKALERAVRQIRWNRHSGTGRLQSMATQRQCGFLRFLIVTESE